MEKEGLDAKVRGIFESQDIEAKNRLGVEKWRN